MRIALIGAGALGCLLGFSLSPLADVWLLSSRPEHAAVLATQGIACECDGQLIRRAVRASATASEIGLCDVALILVKSGQTAWAATQAAKLLAPNGFALTLQNGLGNREILAEALGATRAGQGITALGATLLGLGQVRYAGKGTTIFATQPQPERATELVALFVQAGLPAETSTEIDSLVWGKLVVNCGINALTALLRVPNGSLAVIPEARMLLTAAVSEAVAVAGARDVQLPFADPLAHVLQVAEATAANHSSMLQDVLQGRPTEIEAINGAIVREGARLGVPTPVNAILAALVSALDFRYLIF